MALGIGTTASVFSVADALLVRDLPFPAAGELVSVVLTTPASRGGLSARVANVALYEAWRREAADKIELAGFQLEQAALTGDWSARTVQVVGVTSNTFTLLGARPLHGRSFVSTDEARGTEPSVILSYELWIQLFGADTMSVGRRLTLNGHDYRIIGIMPRGFHIPLSIPESNQGDPELWTPLGVSQELFHSDEPTMPLDLIGRVRGGTTMAAVEGRLNQAMGSIDPRARGDVASVTRVKSLREVRARYVRTPLMFLSGAASLVLLLTCLNVANLLMTRVIAREREVAVRVALGASRSHLVLQLITEGLVLSLAGGLLGTGFAYIAVPELARLGAVYLPDVHAIAINVRVLMFSLIVALASGVAVGAWPAATALDRSPVAAMTSRTPGARLGAKRWMRTLVVLEVAFAVIVLITMGLLGRSFVRLARTARGFDMKNVIVAGFVLPERSYSTAEARRTFTFRLLNELRRDPAIVFPAISSGLPAFGGSVGLAWNGDGPANAQGARVAICNIAGDYFRSLGIPIIAGDSPGLTPNSGGVAIDGAAARVLFGAGNAIGRRIMWGRAKNVGVVTAVVGDVQDLYVNTRTNLRYRSVDPHIYVSTANAVSSVVRISARSRGDTAHALSSLRELIARIDRNLPVTPLTTMEEMVNTQLSRERFLMAIIALFAAMAVAIGIAGIFAVMAHSTAQRTHEIGVRLALGGHPIGIVRLILGDALALTAVGTATGVLGAFALSRILSSVLFETSPFDALTTIGVVVVTAVISLLASAIPALRAARVDSAATLLSAQ